MNLLVRTPWLGAGCLALCVVLSACATRVPPTPAMHALHLEALRLPRKVLVTEVAPSCAPTLLALREEPQPCDRDCCATRHIWQIVAQQEGQALRWLRFDLLGVPDARQILANGRWRNDGFIAPNAAAREMFAALLFAWLQNTDLAATNDARPRWSVIWSNPEDADTFTILRHPDGVRWDVRPVAEEL